MKRTEAALRGFSFNDEISDQRGQNADSDPEIQRQRSTETKIQHHDGYHQKKTCRNQNQRSGTRIFPALETYPKQRKDS